MANILNIKPNELALKINKMEKQERYQQLKLFYLKEYPKTQEFYDHYKKQERKKENCEKILENSGTDEIENEMNEHLNEFKNEGKSKSLKPNETADNTDDILIDKSDMNHNSKSNIDYDTYLDDLFK
jgi:hypothetical protein